MIRAAVKRRLRDIAVVACPDLTVSYTWDGEPYTDDRLWLGLTTGIHEPASIGAQAPLTVDEFTIDCTIEMFGLHDGEEADEAVEQQLNALDAALKVAPRLRHPDLADWPHHAQVRHVRIGSIDGPAHSYPRDLIHGVVLFSLDCVTDI